MSHAAPAVVRDPRVCLCADALLRRIRTRCACWLALLALALPQLIVNTLCAQEQPAAEPPDASEDASEGAGEHVSEHAEGGKAGYYPDRGFIIASPDERYRLRIGLQSVLKAELIWRDEEFQDRTPLYTVRPILAGNFWKKWIQFWTSLELARNPVYLLDSYVDIKPWQEFGVRVGQQYTPLSRHESHAPEQLLFPEYAPVAEYFWSGRDKGITAFGTLGEQLDYYAGFYGGSPLRQSTSFAGNYLFEGRLTYSPMGPVGATEYPYIVPDGEPPAPTRVSFTLQGFYGRVESAEENFNPNTFLFVATATDVTSKNATLAADTLIQGPWFVLFAEGYYRSLDPGEAGDDYDSVGAWGQLGVLLIPNRLDIGARISWLNASTSLDDDQLAIVEAQVAYYAHAPNLVFRLRFGYADQEAPPEDELDPVTLYLPAGQSYIGTLQTSFAF